MPAPDRQARHNLTPKRTPSGAPAANSTFFCEYGGDWCYSHSFRRAGFQAAADDCAVQGGSLVQYSSAAQQMLVEQVRTAGRHPARCMACTARMLA